MPPESSDRPGAEFLRLHETFGPERDNVGWRRWGPYLADRSWATVREDYSADGDAWSYLTHDLSRSKAYRWGEDGIGGICDRYQILCFAPAFWNGRDPILKERLFGLTPHEGNHGEDVKEYYFHSDNTPTHSYMSFLYKYPQACFPYQQLIDENRARAGQGFEYELIDTGVFDDGRYFDLEIEYAKFDVEDIAIRITARNRGPDAAMLHIIPQLWFRNTWAWQQPDPASRSIEAEPSIRRVDSGHDGVLTLNAADSAASIPKGMPIPYSLGHRTLYAESGAMPLFTDNETNVDRVPGAAYRSRSAFVKDAFHRALIDVEDCLNPGLQGTKAGLDYRFDAIPAGGEVTVRLRLSDKLGLDDPLGPVDDILRIRKAEADEFFDKVRQPMASDDEALIQRRALAGMLWTKQFYPFDVHNWLKGDDPSAPPPESRWSIRNERWLHLNSMRIMSVCDGWEYPWFAAWDLAFHCVAYALVDPQYAKDQLWVLLFEQFQHPNGQIPAYEWEFSDLNPPVHAWGVWRVYHMAAEFEQRHYGLEGKDRDFLERCYHKLLINFTWWVNKVDRRGNNIFEGGFLGLDNITIVDRSTPCADGAVIEQADATGWMGMFCLNLMRIGLELAKENPVYQGMATKFFQHYLYVANAMKQMGGRDYQLWDDRDDFFYDVLRYPDGSFDTLRIRSLVGLIPIYAVERLELDWIERFPRFKANLFWLMENRPDLTRDVVHECVDPEGRRTLVLTVVDRDQIRSLLSIVWDAEEFFSPFGVRSLSKFHQAHPFALDDRVVDYEPAESISKLKGGNSNWRGPIWFPTNFLLIESLRKLGKAWGLADGLNGPDGVKTYRAMAAELADRLVAIFRRAPDGRRPVYGGSDLFQHDPHWRDHLLFFEYFHGDEGAGLGASHQTGWTGLVACLIDEWRRDESAPSGPVLPATTESIADPAVT